MRKKILFVPPRKDNSWFPIVVVFGFWALGSIPTVPLCWQGLINQLINKCRRELFREKKRNFGGYPLYPSPGGEKMEREEVLKAYCNKPLVPRLYLVEVSQTDCFRFVFLFSVFSFRRSLIQQQVVLAKSCCLNSMPSLA